MSANLKESSTGTRASGFKCADRVPDSECCNKVYPTTWGCEIAIGGTIAPFGVQRLQQHQERL